MPEAPEVQSVLSDLEKELQGRQILSAEITHPKLADNMEAAEMERRLTGQHFRRFLRHGKYLILEMDDVDWICHLRMEGKFMVVDELPADEKIAKHIHAVFDLDDGRRLCYYDTRKFGRMQVYDKAENKDEHACFRKIGPDILSDAITGSYLYQKVHRRKIPIKTALLDQKVVSGIGNIYADEILFEARLDPRSICSHLSEQDCERIAQAARRIMHEAFRAGGTTIRTFSSVHGQSGTFQDQLKVHVREGKPCLECEGPIVQIKVGQRSTYLCPNCQILK